MKTQIKNYGDNTSLEELNFLIGKEIYYKRTGFNGHEYIEGKITKIEVFPYGGRGRYTVHVGEKSFVLNGNTLFNLQFNDVEPSKMLINDPMWVRIS